MISSDPQDKPDPYAQLRACAAQAKQRTIERLRVAIAAIQGRGATVTVATIKQESGLDYSAYYRNDAAYALYRAHAAHFKPGHSTAKRRRARTRVVRDHVEGTRTRHPRDTLLAYSRPELVAKLRTAWAARDAARDERAAAVQDYEHLLREHLLCAQTIFTLQTKLAQYEEHRDYLRRTMQEREQHL